MPRYAIELACMVQATVNLARAQRLANEAVTCFNATPPLTIPDVIGRAMPRNEKWHIDLSSACDWEVLGVDDAD